MCSAVLAMSVAAGCSSDKGYTEEEYQANYDAGYQAGYEAGVEDGIVFVQCLHDM